MPHFRERDTSRARELRNRATPQERLLWGYLRNRQLAGCKFSRQLPIGPYFCDFVCREKKLIIELDGASHSLQTEYDTERDAFCEHHGYKVLRFSNADVMMNVEGVLTKIEQVLVEMPTPGPSRKREGNDWDAPSPACGRGPGGGRTIL